MCFHKNRSSEGGSYRGGSSLGAYEGSEGLIGIRPMKGTRVGVGARQTGQSVRTFRGRRKHGIKGTGRWS